MKTSMSGIARAMKCPAVMVLPQTRVEGEWAALGSAVHGYLMRIPELGRSAAAESIKIPEHRRVCEGLPLGSIEQFLLKDSGAHEVAFAYDPVNDSAREIGRGIGRQYEGKVEPGEIPGTADWEGITSDESVILDWKTGFADLGDVHDNWQILMYVLASTRARGRSRGRGIIMHLPLNGLSEPWAEETVWSEWDLDLAAVEVREMAARAPALQSFLDQHGIWRMDTSQGPWCTYCPCFDRCPSQHALTRTMLGVDPMAELVPPDQRAQVLDRLKHMRDIVEKVESALKLSAMREPIHLGGQHYYELVEGKNITIEVEKALPMLTARFGPAIEKDVAKALSHESVKRHLKNELLQQRSPGEKPAPLEPAWRVLLEEMTLAKVTKVTPTKAVKKHKRREDAE